MAEKSLFWNARPDTQSVTGYDRNYDADDISEWLGAMITTGVVKGLNALKISAYSGMEVRVTEGKAVIHGKPYVNDSYKAFTVPTAPTIATARKDAIILQFSADLNVRATTIIYRQGDADGSIPKLTRNSTIYEIMIGYITVGQNVTAITQENITDLRGDDTTVITLADGETSIGYCPYVVMVKGYDDYYDGMIQRFRDETTVSSQTSTVTTGMASAIFNPATDLITVYINGELISDDDYTVSTAGGYVNISFDYPIMAGQIVTTEVLKAYDGEGLPNVLADYLNLKAQVEALTNESEYVYVCNGETDNVNISEIANTFLSASATDGAQKHVRIVGTFGMTAPNSGSGAIADRYNVFNLDINTTTNRRITFDFTNCTHINPTITNNMYYCMFAGKNIHIVGGSFELNGTGYLRMFDSTNGEVYADNSRFIINGISGCFVSSNGTFTNCYSNVTNAGGTGYAYWVVSNGMLRLIGGEHYAYSIQGQLNGVIYTTAGVGVVFISGASFPSVTKTGYRQTNYIYQTAGGGYVTSIGAVTMLTASVQTSATILGTITTTKQNQG